MSQPALDPRNSREKMDFLKETIPKISIPIQKLSDLRRRTRRVEERDPHRPISSHSASITFGPSTAGILQDSLRSFSSVLAQSALVQTSFNLHKNCPECATAKEINGIIFISFHPSFFLCRDLFPVQPEIKLNGNHFSPPPIFLCSLKTSQEVTFG